MITLASQIDFDNMIETSQLKYIKVYVLVAEITGEVVLQAEEKVEELSNQVPRQSSKEESSKEEISKEEG